MDNDIKVTTSESGKERAQGKKKMSIKKPKFSLKGALIALIIIALAGVAVFFYLEAQEAKTQTPEAVAQRNEQETETVVSQLGSILLLNSDAEPTVARVEDPSVLQESNPDFYKDIQVGDYLVLYPQRAIIYRQSNKQIINIAPIINTDQLQATQEEQSTQPVVEEIEE